MIQEILTYIIISLAVVYSLYGIFQTVIPSKNKKKNACGGGCSSCSMHNNSNIKIKTLSIK